MSKNFFKKCDQCQKQGKIKKVSSELHIISIKTEVMQQIKINICSLPKVNGLKHLVIYLDYFSKWSETKPIKDKSVPTIAQLFMRLYVGMDVRRFRLRPREGVC